MSVKPILFCSPDFDAISAYNPAVCRNLGDLAKAHGVYGLCYPHYWFEDKTPLSAPLERLLQDGEAMLPFCLRWVNSPLQYRDGDSEIRFEQTYGDEADWRLHFEYLLRFFRHPSYITVQGRPTLLIFCIGDGGRMRDRTRLWRRLAREAGLPGLHLLSMLGATHQSAIVCEEIDGLVEVFPDFLKLMRQSEPEATRDQPWTMDDAWQKILAVPKVHPVQYRGVCHTWDDTQGDPVGYSRFLREQFGRTLADADLPEPFVFVNPPNSFLDDAYLDVLTDAVLSHKPTELQSSPPAVSTTSMPRPNVPDMRTEVMPRARTNAKSPLTNAQSIRPFAAATDQLIEVLLQKAVHAESVLELGCGTGDLARRIRTFLRPQRYIGIDGDRAALELAKHELDETIGADLDYTPLSALGLQPGSFDLIVAADVLGRLRDPWGVLAEVVEFLHPNGHVVVSLPNAQYGPALADLAEGRWGSPGGPTDPAQVRSFTYSAMRDLVTGAGLRILHTEAIVEPPVDLSRAPDSGNEYRSGRLILTGLTRDELIRLHTRRFIILARRARPTA